MGDGSMKRMTRWDVPPQPKLQKLEEEDGNKKRVTRWDVPPPQPKLQRVDLTIEEEDGSKKKVTRWDVQPLIPREMQSEDQLFNPAYFKQSVWFQDYECFYFKKNIFIKLKLPVGLRNTKYGYEIMDIDKLDEDEMKKAFQYYIPKLRVNLEKWYVSNRKFRIFDEENNFLDDIIPDRQWSISMEVIGFKAKGEIVKPMWRIVLAKLIKS